MKASTDSLFFSHLFFLVAFACICYHYRDNNTRESSTPSATLTMEGKHENLITVLNTNSEKQQLHMPNQRQCDNRSLTSRPGIIFRMEKNEIMTAWVQQNYRDTSGCLQQIRWCCMIRVQVVTWTAERSLEIHTVRSCKFITFQL